MKSATEGVDGEQRREAEHHAPRSTETESAADPVGAGQTRWRLDLRAEPRETDRHHEPDDGVADDDRPVGVE